MLQAGGPGVEFIPMRIRSSLRQRWAIVSRFHENDGDERRTAARAEMTLPQAERRLAAILVADVVGYSRLVEADEAGTLAAIKDLRDTLLQPLLARASRSHRQADGRRPDRRVRVCRRRGGLRCGCADTGSRAGRKECPRSAGSPCASVSTSAMSWSRTMICWATASTSRPVWNNCARQAAS